MAQLFDKVMLLRGDDACMQDLARTCGFRSSDAAGDAYVATVPIVLDGLAERVSDEEDATVLLSTARTFRWTERHTPKMFFANPDHLVTHGLTKAVFGEGLEDSVSRVASAAHIAESHAEGLLEVTTTVCLASAIGVSGEELDLDRLVGVLKAESDILTTTPSQRRRGSVVAKDAALAAVGGLAAGAIATKKDAASNSDVATDASNSDVATDASHSDLDTDASNSDLDTEATQAPQSDPTTNSGSYAADDSSSDTPISEAAILAAASNEVISKRAEDNSPAADEPSPLLGEAPSEPVRPISESGATKKRIPPMHRQNSATEVAENVDAPALDNDNEPEREPTDTVDSKAGTADDADGEAASNLAVVGAPELLDAAEPQIAHGDAAETTVLADDDSGVNAVLTAATAKADGGSPSNESATTSDEPGSKKVFVIAGILTLLLIVGAVFFFASGSTQDAAPGTDDGSAAGTAGATGSRQDGSNQTAQQTTTPNADGSLGGGLDDDLREDNDGSDAVATQSDTSTGTEIVRLSVPLRALNESRQASGDLILDFDTSTGEVCYTVSATGIAGPYRTHIHSGTQGNDGGIVIDLGPTESGATGCVQNLRVDTNAVLADPAGHYADLHDVSEGWTVRGQLTDAPESAQIPVIEPAQGPAVVDTDGAGATTMLSGGVVYLEGPVPDQATFDQMVNSVSSMDGRVEIVNDMEIVAGAPLPSGRVIIADAVFFDVASDAIKPISDETLIALSALVLTRQDWTLTVVGHTDAQGEDNYNLELSLRRATAIRDVLSELGVPDENLRIRGAGETSPIGDNNTPEGRALNRRIEFEFTPAN